MTPLSRSPLRLACVLSLFFCLLSSAVRRASAVPSATGHLISEALAALPDGLGREIESVMREMNMTETDTHFSRLVATDVAEVNQSLALVKFPTPENGFKLSFLQMTHDLDPDETYAVLVCGHTRPSACSGSDPHVDAPSTHPCGADDAADPATGPFCEALALSHPSTEHGELLAHASEVLDSVERAYVSDKSAYEVPTLHLHVVDAETFEALMDVDDAGDVDALEAALLARAPEPSVSELEADAPTPSPSSDSLPLPADGVGRKLLRSLLRLGGGIGGVRGAGMRAGIGGVGRFGRAGGIGRGAGFCRGRNMAVNQVMAANFYGNRGRGIGAGQAAYFNDPGLPGGK